MREDVLFSEDEWMSSTELVVMLDFLSLTQQKRSDRKWRLFACACCRRIWRLLIDDRCMRAVEVAERFADSGATEDDLQAARDEANAAEVEHVLLPHPVVSHLRFRAATFAAYRVSGQAAYSASCYSQEAVEEAEGNANASEKLSQIHILRDIMGNPFNPVTIEPAWLTPAVTGLATAAYEERHLPSSTLDNDRLRVLADALEDAGCDNTAILNHCRSGTQHVRGCFVIDLLLGKS